MDKMLNSLQTFKQPPPKSEPPAKNTEPQESAPSLDQSKTESAIKSEEISSLPSKDKDEVEDPKSDKADSTDKLLAKPTNQLKMKSLIEGSLEDSGIDLAQQGARASP